MYTCISIHKANAFLLQQIFIFSKCLLSLNCHSQIFFIRQPYLFIPIYDHLSILCLTDIFVFTNGCKILTDINGYFTIIIPISSFTSLFTYVLFVCLTCLFFFSFMTITFEIAHTILSIYNANTFDVLHDSYIYSTF